MKPARACIRCLTWSFYVAKRANADGSIAYPWLCAHCGYPSPKCEPKHLAPAAVVAGAVDIDLRRAPSTQMNFGDLE